MYELKKQLLDEFKECKKAFIAIGDETRQLIVIALLEGDNTGIRVGELTKKTHLSRPAVSHHLHVLKDADIVNVRREGTKNYYYLDANKSHWKKILLLAQHVNQLVEEAANRQPLNDE